MLKDKNNEYITIFEYRLEADEKKSTLLAGIME